MNSCLLLTTRTTSSLQHSTILRLTPFNLTEYRRLAFLESYEIFTCKSTHDNFIFDDVSVFCFLFITPRLGCESRLVTLHFHNAWLHSFSVPPHRRRCKNTGEHGTFTWREILVKNRIHYVRFIYLMVQQNASPAEAFYSVPCIIFLLFDCCFERRREASKHRVYPNRWPGCCSWRTCKSCLILKLN